MIGKLALLINRVEQGHRLVVTESSHAGVLHHPVTVSSHVCREERKIILRQNGLSVGEQIMNVLGRLFVTEPLRDLHVAAGHGAQGTQHILHAILLSLVTFLYTLGIPSSEDGGYGHEEVGEGGVGSGVFGASSRVELRISRFIYKETASAASDVEHLILVSDDLEVRINARKRKNNIHEDKEDRQRACGCCWEGCKQTYGGSSEECTSSQQEEFSSH